MERGEVEEEGSGEWYTYLTIRDAERSHVEDLGKVDVTSIFPQSTTVLQKPLHVQGQNWRETVDEQLLRGVPEHWLLFSRLPFQS